MTSKIIQGLKVLCQITEEKNKIMHPTIQELTWAAIDLIVHK